MCSGGHWFLLSRCVRDKQRSVGSLCRAQVVRRRANYITPVDQPRPFKSHSICTTQTRSFLSFLEVLCTASRGIPASVQASVSIWFSYSPAPACESQR